MGHHKITYLWRQSEEIFKFSQENIEIFLVDREPRQNFVKSRKRLRTVALYDPSLLLAQSGIGALWFLSPIQPHLDLSS